MFEMSEVEVQYCGLYHPARNQRIVAATFFKVSSRFKFKSGLAEIRL